MICVILLLIICILLHVRYKLKYKWKDIFSPKRWRAVYIWLLKKQLKFFGENTVYLTTSELLQYSNRVSRCYKCLLNGKCLHCGCNAEGRLNGVQDSCSNNEWGAFLSEEEMKDFLNNNEIEFIKPVIRKKNE